MAVARARPRARAAGRRGQRLPGRSCGRAQRRRRDQGLRGLAGARRRRAGAAAGRDRRADRPQRLGQDDAAQHHLRRAVSERRHDHHRRRRCDPAAGARDRPRRSRPHLAEHPPVRGLERHRERRVQRHGALAAARPGEDPRAGPGPAGRDRALRPCGAAGRHARLWRAAAAGDRPRPGAEAALSAARRARRRDEPDRIERAARRPGAAARTSWHRPDRHRPRPGADHAAVRPRHRARPRPGHRRRPAGRHPARSGGHRGLYRPSREA